MALNHYLFQELGFRGNTEQYYDARNSYLNEVLDRRTGIPITLSLVYIEVGRRAGLEVEGVGLPGHFVVRVQTPARGLLVDPFHGGTLLSEKDCQERLDRIFSGKVKLEPKMLRPCGHKDMVERVLRNLKAIHLRDEDKLRALRVVDLLVALQPTSAEDLRDRGVLYAALDCYGVAARDLESYLALAPRAKDAEELRGARGAAQVQGLTAQLTEEGKVMTTVSTASGIDKIEEYLGSDARGLLDHACKGIPKASLHLPGPRWVDEVSRGLRPADAGAALAAGARRPRPARRHRLRLDPAGRPGHRALGGRVLRQEPALLRPGEHRQARDRRRLQRRRLDARRARRGGAQVRAQDPVPGEDQPQRVPDLPEQVRPDHVRVGRSRRATWAPSRSARRSTSARRESARQIVEVSQAFQIAHELGLATVLWCYLRNPAFKKDKDYHVSADLTGQANHLGVTIEADIIKQKLPENNGGYNALSSKENPYGKTDKRIYTELATDHPIDLCRYQVANCYMGRAGLINSGGASGENDFAEAVQTAVINKRAGGMGLISGRKAFQRPMAEGVKLLQTIQDVYLCKE